MAVLHRLQATVILLVMLCAQLCLVALANVRADNFHSRHLLHSEHDRYYEMLAAAPTDEESGVWHNSDASAPLVNRESIEKARVMEMADDAAADEVLVCCLLHFSLAAYLATVAATHQKHPMIVFYLAMRLNCFSCFLNCNRTAYGWLCELVFIF